MWWRVYRGARGASLAMFFKDEYCEGGSRGVQAESHYFRAVYFCCGDTWGTIWISRNHGKCLIDCTWFHILGFTDDWIEGHCLRPRYDPARPEFDVCVPHCLVRAA